MNKLMLSFIFLLYGCDKMPHIVWGNQKVETKEIKKLDNLGGVYFTFDDGPNLLNTPKILDILKKYNIQATFFVEGINLAGESQQANERRALLKRTSDAGHIIANHTYDHKALTDLSEEKIIWEVDTTTNLIEAITGKKVELIRLPYGKNNQKVNKILKSRKLSVVNWNIDTAEWQRDYKTHRIKTKEVIFDEFNKQYNHLKNEQGQTKIILLLHDTKNITVEALPLILEKLKNTL